MADLSRNWVLVLEREVSGIALRLERAGHTSEALRLALGVHRCAGRLNELLILREEAAMALKRYAGSHVIADEIWHPVYEERPEGIWARIVRYDSQGNEICDPGYRPRYFRRRDTAERSTGSYIADRTGQSKI